MFTYHPTMNLKMSSYFQLEKNSSIQVLRALAIFLVLLFHLKIVFPFGFLGVDIFFVISGFVITQSFLKELNKTGHFDPLRFFIRRALRILPALTVMIIFSIILSYFLQTSLQPVGGQQVTAKASIGGLLFIDNLLIPRMSSGYFGALAQENSMTHLWSISVEFQFYLVMALVFFLVFKLGRFRREICISLLVLISSFSLYLFVSLSQDRAFFNLPARVWEFAVGIGLSFGLSKLTPRHYLHSSLKTNVLGAFGISMILLSQTTALDIHLNLRTGAAVIGIAALLIRTQVVLIERNAKRCLRDFFVHSGNISYSLYLYHWPVIVILGAYFPRNIIYKMILAALCLSLANISFKYIEKRIKYSPDSLKRQLWTTLSLFTIAIIFAGVLGLGAKVNWNSRTFGITNPFTPFAGECEPYSADISNCFRSVENSNSKLMVIGDSQAAANSEVFYQFGKSVGYNTLVMSRNGGPILDASCRSESVCIDQMMTEVKRFSPDVLVIANLWNLGEGGSFNLPQLERQLIKPLLKFSKMNNSKLVFVKPLPIMDQYDIYFSKLNSIFLKRTVFSPADVKSQNQISKFLEGVKMRHANVLLLDPSASLCEKGVCQAISDYKALYRDKTHLTEFGALKLIAELQKLGL